MENNVVSFFLEHPWLSGLAAAAGILIISAILYRIIPVIEKQAHKRWTNRTRTDLDGKIVSLLAKALRKIIWLACISLILKNMRDLISPSLTIYANGVLYVFLVLLITNFISSSIYILLDWYEVRWKARMKKGTLTEFMGLFKRLISILLYTIAFVQILNYFRQDISSIIVSLGVGSLAVALAAKDSLANIIAGFMIMTDRPFRIGDRVLLESGEKGDVYDVGLRTTKILTFDNTLLIVPNQQIINEKVQNLTYPDPQIRVDVEVGVAYGSDLDHVKKVLLDICDVHPLVLKIPQPIVRLSNFGNSSLDLRIICRVAEYGQQWTVAEELRMAIYKAFNEEGIEIPFPQRVVTLLSEDKTANN